MMIEIPVFNIPVTYHNFDLIRHTLNLSTFGDLLYSALTIDVSFGTRFEIVQFTMIYDSFQSIHELATYTIITLASLIFSLLSYIVKFPSLKRGEKLIYFVLNLLGILNLMFVICLIYENHKHGHVGLIADNSEQSAIFSRYKFRDLSLFFV